MELCRKYGISQQTFYRWKAKYGELSPSEVKEMQQLREEKSRLKKLVADLALDKQILQRAEDLTLEQALRECTT